MNSLTKYYQNLCTQLQEQIDLIEKQIFKKKKEKEKMADRDYDGDGKIESSKEEYFGSKDKAIKKNMAKKKALKEGKVIGGGQFLYGGFPRILNESGATEQYNDSGDPGPNVATQTDEEESLESMEGRLAKMKDDFTTADMDFSEPGEYRWAHGNAGRRVQAEIDALQKKISQRKTVK